MLGNQPWSRREAAALFVTVINGIVALAALSSKLPAETSQEESLYGVYTSFFQNAQYIDLTHSIHPGMPLYPGFSQPSFSAGRRKDPPATAFSLSEDGFIAQQVVSWWRVPFFLP